MHGVVRAHWPLAVLAVVGCGDEAGRLSGQAVPPEADSAAHKPILSVLPGRRLVFAPVAGEGRVTKPLTLVNGGGGVLVVHEIELEGDETGVFSVAYSPTSSASALPAALSVDDPGAAVRLDVTHQAAPAGEAAAAIRIGSNDREAPVVVVDLVASALRPCVRVDLERLDFGEVAIGDFTNAVVGVTNCGPRIAQVLGVGLSGTTSADFGIVRALPGLDEACLDDPVASCAGLALLAPGETVQIAVRYAPSDRGQDVGGLIIEVGEAGGVLQIELLGEAWGTPG